MFEAYRCNAITPSILSEMYLQFHKVLLSKVEVILNYMEYVQNKVQFYLIKT